MSNNKKSSGYRLQPMSFQLRANIQVQHPIYFLTIPKTFREALSRLTQHFYSQTATKAATQESRFNVPIASLNTALLALFPEIITIMKYTFIEGNQWLEAERPLNLEHFQDVLRSWLSTEFQKVQGSAIFQETFELVETVSWTWEKKVVDFSNTDICENRTAYAENAYFSALPDYICQRLSQEGVHFSFGSEERALYRSEENEVTSWPPFEYYSKNGRKYYYSISLIFSVETIPQFTKPIITMNVRTKRYTSNSLILENGFIILPPDKTSVLMNIPPYWQSSGNMPTLCRAKIEADWNTRTVIWTDKLGEILNRLSWPSQLPSAQQLALKPQDYLTSEKGMALSIVYHNTMSTHGVRHPVGTGSGLLDKNDLLRQVAAAIPVLEPVSSLQRVSKNIRKNLLVQPWEKISDRQRRQSLGEITGGEVSIEILYDSETTLKALRENVLKIIGFENIAPEGNIYKSPQLTLFLTEIPIGELGNELNIDTSKGKVKIKDAVNERIALVEQRFSTTFRVTGTFVELAAKTDFDERVDPKRALRKGLAKTGRVSQFIEKEATSDSLKKIKQESALEKRAENAVLDLLRQLGYLPERFTIQIVGQETDTSPLDIYAFWLIRTNSAQQRKQNLLPLVLHMQSGSSEILARYPQSQGWQPYSKMLLSLGQIASGQESKLPDSEVAGFIQKILQEDIVPSQNALVLVDGYNLRAKWYWLTDKCIDPSRLWVSEKRQGWDVKDIPGIRLVRIRTNEEVPAGYGIKDDGELGLTSGVFAAMGNVFYGVAPKPNTMKNYGTSKAKTRRTNQPNLDHKQPGCVEIYPVLMPADDDPAAWASLVQKMRQMLPSYDDYAIHPLPIHLLKKAEEYLSALE
ncbi:MAG: RNAseH domain-containing protein [Peptococcaceae bacterium]|nr:RNAseH domain-containing protein [Peptococcaceae bacterium]